MLKVSDVRFLVSQVKTFVQHFVLPIPGLLALSLGVLQGLSWEFETAGCQPLVNPQVLRVKHKTQPYVA